MGDLALSLGVGLDVSEWGWMYRSGVGCIGVGLDVSEWGWMYRSGVGCIGVWRLELMLRGHNVTFSNPKEDEIF